MRLDYDPGKRQLRVFPDIANKKLCYRDREKKDAIEWHQLEAGWLRGYIAAMEIGCLCFLFYEQEYSWWLILAQTKIYLTKGNKIGSFVDNELNDLETIQQLMSNNDPDEGLKMTYIGSEEADGLPVMIFNLD